VPQGTVKAYDVEARTGSLLTDDQEEIAIDAGSVEGAGIRYLRIGQRVVGEHALVKRLGLLGLPEHLVVDARGALAEGRHVFGLERGHLNRRGEGGGELLVGARLLGHAAQAIPQVHVLRAVEEGRLERGVGGLGIAQHAGDLGET
jgi:cold shock CspA family protein